tara:strand:+ start:279 stop:452 length:174 start_codon:yes stop_codon:yes gene_type:complete
MADPDAQNAHKEGERDLNGGEETPTVLLAKDMDILKWYDTQVAQNNLTVLVYFRGKW